MDGVKFKQSEWDNLIKETKVDENGKVISYCLFIRLYIIIFWSVL